MNYKALVVGLTLILVGQGCISVNVNVEKGAEEATVEVKPAMFGGEETVNTIQEQEEISMTNTLDNQIDLVAEYSKAILKTNKGDIKVEFFGADSPITVNNFLNLAQNGFYDGTSFHRIIKDFMIQGGDPNSKDQEKRESHGTGDPGYKFDDEFNEHKLIKGSLAMANSGPNTNGSQFFIVTLDATPWLDGKHTNFGAVVEGIEIVDAIEAVETDARDNPIEPVVILSIELLK